MTQIEKFQMPPVRVLIHEPYPFGKIAGNLRTQIYIIEKINTTKFTIALLSPFETEFTKEIRNKGIETYIATPSTRLNRYGGQCLQDKPRDQIFALLDLVSYNVKLRRLFVEKRIDLVYCNCIRSVLTVGLAARLAGIPIFWFIKGELQNPFLDYVGFLFASKINFYCVSNKDDKYPLLTTVFRKKIGVLRSGVDLGAMQQVEKYDSFLLKKELNVTSNTINCVYLGQIYAPKGVHDLIHAFGYVKAEFPQIRLYIVGDYIIDEYKNYYDDLISLVDQKGLENHVVFTGWRSDALQILSLMDILIHPSLSEGFPRSVLEGMALGKAVIATKVGGTRELINDGVNGFLIDPGSPAKIAEKLSLLLKDQSLRLKMGKAARKTIYSDYNIDDRIKELEQIWSDMAAK